MRVRGSHTPQFPPSPGTYLSPDETAASSKPLLEWTLIPRAQFQSGKENDIRRSKPGSLPFARDPCLRRIERHKWRGDSALGKCLWAFFATPAQKPAPWQLPIQLPSRAGAKQLAEGS